MIASVQGILKQRYNDSCVVECGGVGYEVFLNQRSLHALPSKGESVEFFTYFHVREDSQQLFGFESAEEKALFLLLLSVKGVGPKLGMAILSQLPTGSLLLALKKRDLARLSSVPGVGKKLAERLGLELHEKAAKFASVAVETDTDLEASEGSEQEEQALSALLALGYNSQQAKQALYKAYQSLGSGKHRLEDLVKNALKFF
jgi:Holliday junction DNA helicase RuvA